MSIEFVSSVQTVERKRVLAPVSASATTPCHRERERVQNLEFHDEQAEPMACVEVRRLHATTVNHRALGASHAREHAWTETHQLVVAAHLDPDKHIRILLHG